MGRFSQCLIRPVSRQALYDRTTFPPESTPIVRGGQQAMGHYHLSPRPRFGRTPAWLVAALLAGLASLSGAREKLAPAEVGPLPRAAIFSATFSPDGTLL